jgi:hypothetical protein
VTTTKSSGSDKEATVTDTSDDAELPETDFEKAQREEIEAAGAEY